MLYYEDMDRYYPVFPVWAACGGYLPNPEMVKYVPPMHWWLILEQLYNREYYYAWINNECGDDKDYDYEEYLIVWLVCLELTTEYIALPTVYDEDDFDWPTEEVLQESFWSRTKKWLNGIFKRGVSNA